MVLCTATWLSGVPEWRAGTGLGWVTAEYDMLPASTSSRRKRNRGSIDGRTQEIQRLVGRALRCVVDFQALGEHSILLDCDVLQADGGTRTASINGAYVALCDAVRFAAGKGWVRGDVVREAVGAISVGRVDSRILLDLDYEEDSRADVDLNVVMLESGGLVEVQGTAERGSFSPRELERMLRLASGGIRRIMQLQQKALGRRT
jgi:ribonuclease PH